MTLGFKSYCSTWVCRNRIIACGDLHKLLAALSRLYWARFAVRVLATGATARAGCYFESRG